MWRPTTLLLARTLLVCACFATILVAIIESRSITGPFLSASPVYAGHEMVRNPKSSSLRFDWTNLPPMTPLGRILEQSQSRCLNRSAMQENGPLEIVTFNIIPSGIGSSLHTWMNPLCHASEQNKILVTGSRDTFGQEWLWNDEFSCPEEFERQKASGLNSAWSNHMDNRTGDTQSTLWCYFGWHESGLRCPPGTLRWDTPSVDFRGPPRRRRRRRRRGWQLYQCNEYHQKYGRGGVLSAAAEWLFQNVSQLVIREAERQIREAFPITILDNTSVTGGTTSGTRMPISTAQGFQRWTGLPTSDALITVHIRWGDKAREMKLVSMGEIIDGIKSLLTEDECTGRKAVHIYVATESSKALHQLHKVAAANWRIHASGPKIPDGESVRIMDQASESKGKMGLQSLAALLISLEANRYVLTTGSNWSRLINELRKSVVNSRCSNCTQMVDLRYGES